MINCFKIIFTLFTIVLLNPSRIDAQNCASLQDYDALMAIYNTNGGSSWTNNGQPVDWNQDCSNLNEWDGVITNPDGTVARLLLDGFGLTGVLAPEIQNLSQLRVLRLNDNSLTGTLPISLTTLPELRFIDLRNNQYEGCIPSEWDVFCSLNTNHIKLEGNPCLANQPSNGSGVFGFYCNNSDCMPATDSGCPTCDDGIQNGDETGIDCGGQVCGACPALTNVVALSVGLQNGITAQHVGGQIQLNVAYEIENTDFSPTAKIGFYYSRNTTWDTSDRLITKITMNNVVGQYSFGLGNILTIPLNAPPGQGYIIMYADYTEALTESDENDNFAITPIEILGPECDDGILNGDEDAADCGGSCVPCSASNIRADELTIRNGVTEEYPGGNFLVKVKYEVEDFAYTENARVGFYFSEDQTYDEGVDIFLEDIAINKTVGFYQFNFGNVMQLPLSAPPGPAYIIMFVDNEYAVTESNELDNYAMAPITVLGTSCTDGIPNGDETGVDCGGSCPPCGVPDIVAVDFQVQGGATQFYAGDNLKFEIDYDILGADLPLSPKQGYYFTQDPNFDPTDPTQLADPANILIYQGSMNTVVNSYSFTVSNPYNIPFEAPPGDAFLVYYTDHLEQISEYDEGNNRLVLPIEIIEPFADRCCEIEIIANDGNFQSLDDFSTSNVTITGGIPNAMDINDLLDGNRANQICLKGNFNFSETIELLRGDALVLAENTELHYTGGNIAFNMTNAQGAVVQGKGTSSVVSMDNGAVCFDIFANPDPDTGSENNNIVFKDFTIINDNAIGPFGNNSGGTAIRIHNPSDYNCNTNKGCNITALDGNFSAYLTRIQNLTIENFHTGIRMIDQANGTLVSNIQMNNITRYGMYTSGCVDNALRDIHINDCDSPDGSCNDLSVIRIEAHLLPLRPGESYCNHQDDNCHLVRPGPAGYFNIFLNTIVGAGVQHELFADNLSLYSEDDAACISALAFNEGCPVEIPDPNDPDAEPEIVFFNWLSPWRNRIEFINTIDENEANIGTFLVGDYPNPQIHPDNYICVFEKEPTSNIICVEDRSLRQSESSIDSSIDSPISIRPNPTSHSIEIRNRNNETAFDLHLFTIDGKIIKEESSVLLPEILNVSDLPNGLYFLKLSSENGKVYTEKIIISK